MSDARDIDDQVDFEEDNDSEIEDEVEVEELVEEEYVDVVSDSNAEGNDLDENGDTKVEDMEEEEEEEEEGEEEEEEEEDQAQSPEEDIDVKIVDNEDEPDLPVNEDESEKFSHLLSLPPHGSEVFIGGISRDVREEDIRDLCEPISEIFEVRLTKDKDTGESKGCAFVVFRTRSLAEKAVEELHDSEFKGKTIRCSISETKNQLFVGNIPKNWTDDEFKKFLESVGPGVEYINLKKDATNVTRNRGFAFVSYFNNACADYSRQKMIDPSFKIEGNTLNVTWADPKASPDNSAAASQVKALYVKNIPENTSTEQLKELFQKHGEVVKVVMPPGKDGKRNFAFINYAERSSALKAIKDTENYEINGQSLDVALAKPQAERKPDSSHSYGAAITPTPFMYPAFGNLPTTTPYGSMGLPNNFNQQPMIYGGGTTMPAGLQMVPMLLPDGQVGFVLQQPGIPVMPQAPQASQGRRSDRSNGSGRGPGRGPGRGQGRGSNADGYRGRRYRPY